MVSSIACFCIIHTRANSQEILLISISKMTFTSLFFRLVTHLARGWRVNFIKIKDYHVPCYEKVCFRQLTHNEHDTPRPFVRTRYVLFSRIQGLNNILSLSYCVILDRVITIPNIYLSTGRGMNHIAWCREALPLQNTRPWKVLYLWCHYMHDANITSNWKLIYDIVLWRSIMSLVYTHSTVHIYDYTMYIQYIWYDNLHITHSPVY